MASTQNMDVDPFSSSPARPSHTHSRLVKTQSSLIYAAASAVGQKKNLKRTASTASLLTPPASSVKQHRSKRSLMTDDEDDAIVEDGSPASPSPRVSPRRNPGRAGKAGLFHNLRRNGSKSGGSSVWSAAPTVEGSSPIKPSASLSSINSPKRPGKPVSVDAELAIERVQKMALGSGLVGSPPTTPKRRRARVQTPTPVEGSTKSSTDWPRRDSPSNPFLDSSPIAGTPRKKREPIVEQPTMTYVFRGVKAVFRNPAYGVPEPVEGDPSTLPPNHPDFSPNLITAPRLLFPPPGAEESDAEDSMDEKYRILPKLRNKGQPKSPAKRVSTKAPETPPRPTKKRRIASGSSKA